MFNYLLDNINLWSEKFNFLKKNLYLWNIFLNMIIKLYLTNLYIYSYDFNNEIIICKYIYRRRYKYM